MVLEEFVALFESRRAMTCCWLACNVEVAAAAWRSLDEEEAYTGSTPLMRTEEAEIFRNTAMALDMFVAKAAASADPAGGKVTFRSTTGKLITCLTTITVVGRGEGGGEREGVTEEDGVAEREEVAVAFVLLAGKGKHDQ